MRVTFETWKGRESKKLWYLWEVWRVFGIEKVRMCEALESSFLD